MRIKNRTEFCLWAVLALIMVMVALFFGLHPKGWPFANDARWNPDERAIRFQGRGIAYVDRVGDELHFDAPGPLTIEMAVTPENIERRGYNPLLVMHDGADRRQLAVWQYGASLIVMNGDDYDNSRRRPRIVGRNVLSARKTRYLTVTAGEQGTRLFVDGVPAATNSDWKMSIPDKGTPLRLVLGNSVYGRHGWKGLIHGLAISRTAISDEAVRLRSDQWAADRNFDFTGRKIPLLLYTFNEKNGNGFVSQSAGHQVLEIPEYITVLKRIFLSPPRHYFKWRRSAVGDIVVNITGFIPVGAVLYGFLQCFSGLPAKYRFLTAVALCLLLSLGIELAQAWIPTRVSSLLDLILNTMGACLGIGLGKMATRKKSSACS